MSLARPSAFTDIAEVNPPRLPSGDYRQLAGRWREVLVTDNPFRQVRISPYAFAARLTHDLPEVRPTVVCSTRDRNMLAIESEVRGALGNGVRSFLVVKGDSLPEVEHWSDAFEIVELLTRLRERTVPFEIGMSVPPRRSQLTRRAELGAQFLVCGPVLDPASVEGIAHGLALAPGDPPVYLSLVPPFSPRWARRLAGLGAAAVGSALARRMAEADWSRAEAWGMAGEVRERANQAGFAGSVLMGCRFETTVDEAYWQWRRPAPASAPQLREPTLGVPNLSEAPAAH